MKPDLPAGWGSASLEEVLPLSYGKGLPRRQRQDGAVPVFGSSGIVGWHSEALVDHPTLIVGRKGSVGAVYYSDGPSWPIDTVYYVSKTRHRNLRFFGHLLDSLQLSSLDKSTTVPGLSRDDYNAVYVPVPPLGEQVRIADALDAHLTRLDVAASALARIRANLTRYRASVLKAACEGRLVPSEAELAQRYGRDYEPANVLLQRILAERRARWEAVELQKLKAKGKSPKDDRWKKKYKEPERPDTGELPQLREGWVWARIDTIAETSSGGTPSRKHAEYFGGRIPWVKSGELGDGSVYGSEETITEPGLANSSAKIFPSGTLCIALYGATVGKLGILEIDAATNQAVCAIFVPDLVDTKYVFWCLRAQRDALIRRGKGGAQPNISQAIVRETFIPVPPLAEQHCIVEEIERLFSLADAVMHARIRAERRAKALRQAILTRAFEGRLVPQDPNDESARVLLDRIRAEREDDAKTRRCPKQTQLSLES